MPDGSSVLVSVRCGTVLVSIKIYPTVQFLWRRTPLLVTSLSSDDYPCGAGLAVPRTRLGGPVV